MKAKLLAATLLAAGFAGAAGAQDHAEIDANADGQLSLAEVQTAMPDVTEEEFLSYDTDADSQLSFDEYSVWADAAVDADVETDPLEEPVDDAADDAGMTYDDGSDEEPEDDMADPQ